MFIIRLTYYQKNLEESYICFENNINMINNLYKLLTAYIYALRCPMLFQIPFFSLIHPSLFPNGTFTLIREYMIYYTRIFEYMGHFAWHSRSRNNHVKFALYYIVKGWHNIYTRSKSCATRYNNAYYYCWYTYSIRI